MLGRRIFSLTCMLFAVSAVGVATAGEARVRTVASESATIFLTEIQNVQPGEGCEYFHLHKYGRCKTKVRARLLRVFKGEYDREKVPAEFEVEIQQTIITSAISPWSDSNIQAGQRYLILTAARQVLPSVFASTVGPLLVTDQEDMVGDLELILNTESLTQHQQASAVAAAISASGTPHSYFLAHYAAGLLAAGSDADTLALARAVEESTDHAFSHDAKVALLGMLWDQSKSATKAPENLLKTYFFMTTRYFLLPPDAPNPGRPSLREEILSRAIPWLVGSEQAKALIRTALPPALRQQLRTQAVALAADERQRPERRQLMKELLPLIGPN
jgi:hypothetical protein